MYQDRTRNVIYHFLMTQGHVSEPVFTSACEVFHLGRLNPCLRCPSQARQAHALSDGALGFGYPAHCLPAWRCLHGSLFPFKPRLKHHLIGEAFLDHLPVPFYCFILFSSINTQLRYTATRHCPDPQWAGPWKVGQATCKHSPVK